MKGYEKTFIDNTRSVRGRKITTSVVLRGIDVKVYKLVGKLLSRTNSANSKEIGRHDF